MSTTVDGDDLALRLDSTRAIDDRAYSLQHLPGAFYVLVALAASTPAWIVRHPPLQDLPIHLATLRVVHDYWNPAYGFQQDLYLNLWPGSYVLYYLAGSALALVVGVERAHVVLMCVYLAGTPLALRELLKAFGKDERLCLFSVPLVFNMMFMMGLLPFVFGIPLMLLAMAAAARYFERPSGSRAVWLGALSLLLFLAHALPFALFGIAFTAMFPWTQPGRWLRAGAPVMPSLVCVLLWVALSSAGRASVAAIGGVAPITLDQKLAGLLGWSIDIFSDTSEETWFVLLVVVAVLASVLAQGDPDRSTMASRGFGLVVLVCMAAYLLLGNQLGDVWLFAERFPAPGFICAIPLLRFPVGWRGRIVLVAVLFVVVGSTVNVCEHFMRFESDEVGDIDRVIDSMAPRKRVVGLIYDRGSNVVRYAPFLHFVSYYQARKGGVTTFNFASFRHWPYRFRAGHFPPPGTPLRYRWEWTPHLVTLDEIYPYYDYVLVRGNGFRPPPGTYHVMCAASRWTVWARD